MNADILTTKVTDGIALITLGSPKRIYFDAEMDDALTEALEGFAGDANVRVVVVTGAGRGLGGVPESTLASIPFSATIKLNTSPAERTPCPGR